MGTLISVVLFFVLYGTLFGLPVLGTMMFVRHRERRLQHVFREIKRQYRLRGRGRALLLGRIEGRQIRIARDLRRGVQVSVDLLPSEVRRRHAQWNRDRALALTATQERLLAYCVNDHARRGARVEGRWTFSLGPYPTIDAIESALETIREGVTEEVRYAEVAAAAQETDQDSARQRLEEISSSDREPVWLRAEAYRALIAGTAAEADLEGFGHRLAESRHAQLRKLSAVAWNRIDDPRAVQPIRALLADNHPTVVEAAAGVLAKRSNRDDREAETLLLSRLKDENGPLLFVIVRALGSLGSSAAVAELSRWSSMQSTLSSAMRETIWRESTRIRMSLGLNRGRNGGQLSIPPRGGELSAPGDHSPNDA